MIDYGVFVGMIDYGVFVGMIDYGVFAVSMFFWIPYSENTYNSFVWFPIKLLENLLFSPSIGSSFIFIS